jgi:hypothetical protein
MQKRRLWWSIAERVLLEFGPPLLLALIWAGANVHFGVIGTGQSKFAAFSAHFGAAFVVVGIAWWNLLRIHHQQSARAKQDDIAAAVNTIESNLSRIVDVTKQYAPAAAIPAVEASANSIVGATKLIVSPTYKTLQESQQWWDHNAGKISAGALGLSRRADREQV